MKRSNKNNKKRNITSIANLIAKTNREIETMTDFKQVRDFVIRVANRYNYKMKDKLIWKEKVLFPIFDKFPENIYIDIDDFYVGDASDMIQAASSVPKRKKRHGHHKPFMFRSGTGIIGISLKFNN